MSRLDLDESYAYCEKITRERAKNFYYGIRLLPLEQRRSMCAMYAFFRYCDDVSDGDIKGTKAVLLQQWRRAIDSNEEGSSLILPAFYDAKHRHEIPADYFHSMIDGVEADLSKTHYASFAELYRYCYCVASTVGLVCLHVYGFDHLPQSLQMAEWRGIAFQLTNILRDIAEDLSLGRVYLPADELKSAGITEQDLLSGRDTPVMRQFLKEQVLRAQDYYERAAGLEERVNPECRNSLEAMTGIYRALLHKVASMGCKVLKKRAQLSTVEKLRLAGKTLLARS